MGWGDLPTNSLSSWLKASRWEREVNLPWHLWPSVTGTGWAPTARVWPQAEDEHTSAGCQVSLPCSGLVASAQDSH